MLANIDILSSGLFLRKYLPGIAVSNLGASEAEAKAYLKALIPYWKQGAITERFQENFLVMVLEENLSKMQENQAMAKLDIALIAKELKSKLPGKDRDV